MTVTTIARLKITLDDVEPAVQRRVEVPLKIRLDRLHLVFQAAIGWSNSHLYEIRAGGVGWGMVDPDWGDGPMDASKSRLLDVLEDMGVKTLKYLYDFGDGWEHTVKIERIADALPGFSYPALIDATGRCPPEDVGGPPAYDEVLKILVSPKHKRYAEMIEWLGTTFDPRDAGKQNLAEAVDALARKWSRKPKDRSKIKPKITN
ncbi:MAG TPA: plasmid pRiA4b ORF-3 family protein [Methylococcaceae bacterium]|nr:plasmid pRiA4b ORF-3 family protein [Methylococcaceae bacterium]